MTVLNICWRCVTERVLLGLWLVNQVEESVRPAVRRVLRRMVEPAKALSVIGVIIAGLPIALAGQISPGTLRWTGSCNGLLESSISETTDQSRMSWNRQNYWCWRVDPVIEPTGQIYDYIQIDGTYLPYGWCLLTAVNSGKVLAWQWCNQENKTAYKQLLKRLPEPLMVVTDGQAGALSAIKDQESV